MFDNEKFFLIQCTTIMEHDELSNDSLNEWVSSAHEQFVKTRIAEAFGIENIPRVGICLVSTEVGSTGVSGLLQSDKNSSYLFDIPTSDVSASSSIDIISGLDTSEWDKDESVAVSFFYGGRIGDGYEMEDFIGDGAEESSEELDISCLLANFETKKLTESAFEGGECIEGTCAGEDDLDLDISDEIYKKIVSLDAIFTP